MPPFPELKDISPPTPPPFSAPEEVQALIWQVFGVVTVVVFLTALWLWWRWRVRRAKAPALPQPALDQLRNRLASLHPQAAELAPGALAQQVGDVIRTYLQREHGLLARYRTTEELFGTVRGPRRANSAPPLPFLRPFENVFEQCDAMKFAGTGVAVDHRTGLIDRALAAAEEVRNALNRRPAPPALPESGAAASVPPPLGASCPPAVAVTPPAFDSAPASLVPAGAAGTALIAPPTPLAPPLSPPAPPRSDSFTHPQTAAFARGADVIPV